MKSKSKKPWGIFLTLKALEFIVLPVAIILFEKWLWSLDKLITYEKGDWYAGGVGDHVLAIILFHLLLALGTLFIVGAVTFVRYFGKKIISSIIKSNWELAEKISKKLNERGPKK